MNLIFNENCFKTMNRAELLNNVDLIITSPPNANLKKVNQEYIDWSIDLFKSFDKVLKENGCVLYNLSYSKDIMQLFSLIKNITDNTNFTIFDNVIWKKDTPVLNNRSKNKLNKLTEYIFVFCRKNEVKTFNSNKKVTSYSDKLDRPTSYSDIDDFITAPNNNGYNSLSKESYSIELVVELLNRYGIKDGLVYDPFIGLGTTAIGAKKFGMNYIGSEIDIKQVEYANSQLHEIKFVDDEYRIEVIQSSEDDEFWN